MLSENPAVPPDRDSEKSGRPDLKVELLAELDTAMEAQRSGLFDIGRIAVWLLEETDTTRKELEKRYPEQVTRTALNDGIELWREFNGEPVEGVKSAWDHLRVMQSIRPLKRLAKGHDAQMQVSKIPLREAVKKIHDLKIGGTRESAKQLLIDSYCPLLKEQLAVERKGKEAEQQAKAEGKVSAPMMDHPKNANRVYVVSLNVEQQEEEKAGTLIHRTLVIAPSEAEARKMFGAERKKMPKPKSGLAKELAPAVTNAGIMLNYCGDLVTSPGVYALIKVNVKKGATEQDVIAAAEKIRAEAAKVQAPTKAKKKKTG